MTGQCGLRKMHLGSGETEMNDAFTMDDVYAIVESAAIVMGFFAVFAAFYATLEKRREDAAFWLLWGILMHIQVLLI